VAPNGDAVSESPANAVGDEPPTVSVAVEIPKGSRNKYEMDPDTGRIALDRMLFSSVHYPADYGFVEDTLAEDGDALDALVLVGEPTFPGCPIEARPVGVFEMTDEKGPDAKILCVPVGDPQYSHVDTIDDVAPHLLKEVEHFFEVYKDLEERKTSVEGWEGLEAVIEAIEDARERYDG